MIHSEWEDADFNYGWLVTKRSDIELYTVSPISKLPEGIQASERFCVKLYDENDEPYWEERVYVGTDEWRRDYALTKGLYYIER